MARRRPPPLESLRIFEACARHLNFTRAGVELGLTQAAVSLRIRNLEADLGAKLFSRSRPRPSLSPEGEALAREIGGALNIVAGAVSRAQGPAPLRVTATPSFARWLAPKLARFTERETGCAVELDVSVEQRKVGDDGFHLAIRSGLGNWRGVNVQRLVEIERTLMLSPELRASLGRRAHVAALTRVTLLPDERWLDWLALAGVDSASLRVSATKFASQDMVAEAAMAGAGAALLSPWLFRDLLRSEHLVAPFSVRLRGPDAYFMLTRGMTSRIEAFSGWLTKEVSRSQTK